MAKILKVEGYIIDPDDSICPNDIATILSNNDMIIKHFNIIEKDINEWDDNLVINHVACPKEKLEKYFES